MSYCERKRWLERKKKFAEEMGENGAESKDGIARWDSNEPEKCCAEKEIRWERKARKLIRVMFVLLI